MDTAVSNRTVIFLKMNVTFFVLLCAVSLACAGAQCYSGWKNFGSSCYGFGDDNVAWGSAAELCRIFDGYLAEIESAEENEFIKGIAQSRNYSALWIGGTDIFSEGNWIWAASRNRIVEFTDWYPGEPNHAEGPSAEDCLQMYGKEGMHWNDETCSMKYPFICEVKMEEEIPVGRR